MLISQGTVEKDPGKLIVPALEALKDSGALLIVTTGYGQTETRTSYPQDNIIIEDSSTSIYPRLHGPVICNGGYGSMLLSLRQGCAGAGGRRPGRQERRQRARGLLRSRHRPARRKPRPADIRRGAARILSEPEWKRNVARLQKEFSGYRPNELIDAYLVASDTFHQPGSRVMLQVRGPVSGRGVCRGLRDNTGACAT